MIKIYEEKSERKMKTNTLRPIILFLVAIFLITSSACGAKNPTPEATVVVPVEPVPSFDCSKVTDVPQIECEALSMLFTTTNGGDWLNKTGWMEKTTVGDWYGVKINEGHVQSINLSQNQLAGFIPSEIANLSYLSSLDLSNNALAGYIPSELGSLSNLRSLILSFNQLTNEIPPSLGNLTKLNILFLSKNQLSGNVPVELGNLTQLQKLLLYENQLTGGLPVTLKNLTALNEFGFFGTSLCEPPTSDYQTWKTAIEKYYGTGSVCK